ncbi:MAG: ATP-binding protein [Porticoccaceae bacterium]|nr:ATP-binding protein [Porticoccaceae bacterium]
MIDANAVTNKERFSAGLLRLYLYYRFLLALLLVAAIAANAVPDVFGASVPSLFQSTAISYVVIAVITLGFYQLQHHSLKKSQLLATLIADIAIQTLLMYSSGGLGSGFGYLMLVTVAAGSIFFSGQLAVLIPAIASICIIAESVLSAILFDRTQANVLPAGVLGLLLFFTSLLFSRLSKALVAAQEIAASESELSAELQELNQLIINRMRTGIVVIDDSGLIHQINNAAQELLGNSHSFRIGDSISGESGLLKRLIHWKQNPAQKTLPFISQRGNTELQANFARLEQSDNPRTIIFLEDFRAAAQEAQQLKLASLGRLTASIAHEVRNPLGAISHASELLAEIRETDKVTTRLTEIIETQVKRVNHIVESILQLSRQHSHQPQRIKIRPWLEHYLDNYLQGNRAEPKIAVRVSESAIDEVTFDPVHLQQVLNNLLDNAVRYSTEATGLPWAEIVVSRHSDQNVVYVDICDAGVGVPADDRSKLFEPFFTTSPGGSGLGLYICRELCAMNFATIKYQPPQGKEKGFFRITFIHPDKILNINEASHEPR